MFGAVVLLVSATLLLGANISALRGNLAWMDHSQRVLNQIAILETTDLGEELTIRGYALTGDSRFLDFQKQERGKCQAALAELHRLSAVESGRRAEFGFVERTVRQHLDMFGNLPIHGADRAEVVARAIVDPAVRAHMRRTRNGLVSLRAAELSDLASRQRAVTDQLGRAFFLALGIILAAFLLGGAGVWAAQIKGPRR